MNRDLENELYPKRRRYVILKEVQAISIADALRKERSGEIFQINEMSPNEEDAE